MTWEPRVLKAPGSHQAFPSDARAQGQVHTADRVSWRPADRAKHPRSHPACRGQEQQQDSSQLSHSTLLTLSCEPALCFLI